MREVGRSGTGRYLVKQVKAAGGMAEKLRWHRRGPPDYLVTWDVLGMDLVETKAPGKIPRPEQLRDHKRRAALGVVVLVLDTKAKIDRYVCLVLDTKAKIDRSLCMETR